jgi:hypothetical protein
LSKQTKETTTMPNVSRLMRELRKRYATPAHVLRRLGLDTSLLDASLHDDLGKRVQARYPAAHKFMLALARSGISPKTALARLGMDAAMLDDEPGLREAVDALMQKHFPDATDDNPFFKGMHELVDEHERRSDPRGKGGGGGEIVGSGHEGDDDLTGEEIVQKYGSFDADPPVEHPASQQNLGGRDDGLGAFRDHLRENSDMTEDQIEEACGLARDHIRRRGSNGVDKRFGKDKFPVNGVRSSERPAPSRGHFGGERRSGQTQTGGALDEAPKSRRLLQMFPGLGKIEREPSVASSDRHVTYGAPAPSGRERARMDAMFPYLRKIGSSMDVGPGASGDGRPGKYEV